MGGRGAKSPSGGATSGISQNEVNKVAQDHVAHNLGAGETYAIAENAKIVGPVDENGQAPVEIHYKVDVEVPVGRDLETGAIEYETETEYRTKTVILKVR